MPALKPVGHNHHLHQDLWVTTTTCNELSKVVLELKSSRTATLGVWDNHTCGFLKLKKNPRFLQGMGRHCEQIYHSDMIRVGPDWELQSSVQ